jgi:hypothetical protein
MLLKLGLTRKEAVQATIEPRVVHFAFCDVQQIIQRSGRIPVLLHSQLAARMAKPVALKRLAELYSVDIVLPTVEGREIWLRRITKLNDEQQRILHQLQLQLPERLEPIQIQNVVKTRPWPELISQDLTLL